MKFIEVEVCAYSGYMANERPVSFRFKGRQYHIIRIIDRWHEWPQNQAGPFLNYFKVETNSEEQYILRYNSLFDVWSVMSG